MHYSHLDEVLQDDPLSQKMHVLPLHARPHCRLHRTLCLKDRLIDLTLSWSEFTGDWEGHRLVCHITVPLASEIEEHHLSLFDQLVVLDVVKSGAVAAR